MVAAENLRYVVPDRDPEPFIAALVELVTDPARRAALGAANRQKALAEYSLATMVERWRGLWDEMARA